MADYNSVMFVLARESRGLTQAALAEGVGTDQGAISRIENGEKSPSPGVVRLIAQVLDYPEVFFSQPLKYRNLPVTFYRKQKSLPKTAVRKIQALVNVRQLQLGRLLGPLEVTPIRIQSVNAKGFEGGVDRIARELRLSWHLPPGPVANVTRTLEAAGVLVVPFDFGNPKIDGLSIFDSSSGLPPMIFVSNSIPGDRLRWTLIHETAHIILHHHLQIPPPDSEEQANRFAGEFLMPRSEIYGQLTGLTFQALTTLKPYWKVSMQALVMRAWALGLLSNNGRKKLLETMSKYGYRKHEPIQVEREEPSLINDVIQTHLRELGASEKSLSELVLSNLDEFRATYAPQVGLRLIPQTGGTSN